MINPANSAFSATGPQEQAVTVPRKVLRMVTSDRMAGSVPAWVDASSVREEIAENLRTASLVQPGQDQSALALSETAPLSSESTEEPFGFADLLDMVNPLQHIPLINHLYRSLTGDTIKPASQIVGGAVFAGPLGAASGLINVIVQEETGKDVMGNAMSLAMKGELPSYKIAKKEPSYSYSTRTASAQKDFSSALLAFTDLSHPEIKIEKSDEKPLYLKETY